jgi:hypothetical protein
LHIAFQKIQFGFRAERELHELRRQVDLLNRLMIQNSCNTSGKPEQSEEEMNRMVEELTEVQGFLYKKNYIFKKNYFAGMRSHLLWAVLARDKATFTEAVI